MMDFDPEEAELRRTITAMANHDPVGLRQMLLDRIADSFKSEAGNTDDVSAALFGREAEQGVRLLQLLDRRYAVVVTNPPYMGSKNMNAPLRKYVEKHYLSGKRDLYTAFILRCLELCRVNGRVAMVTMQNWMFLRSFAELRAKPEEELSEKRQEGNFAGILRESSIEALAHLGRYAFSEIDVPGTPLLFILKNTFPPLLHRLWSCRLTARRPAEEQSALLMRASQEGHTTGVVFILYQSDFLTIPETPIVYWLQPSFFKLLRDSHRLSDIADVRAGLQTSNNERFLRCFWEIINIGVVSNCQPVSGRWFWFSKGGGYQKWAGLEWLVIDWYHNGAAIKAFIVTLPGTTHWSRYVRSENYYFRPGLTYTVTARGLFAARILDEALFDVAGTSIFPKEKISRQQIAALTSSRIPSYLLRITAQSLSFPAGYVAKLNLGSISTNLLEKTGIICIMLKFYLVSHDPTERRFDHARTAPNEASQALLHSLEALNEIQVCEGYKLDNSSLRAILNETGMPAGWYPLISGYDALPPLPDALDLPQLPQEFFDYLATHERINPGNKELARIKTLLRLLYESGPGAKNVEQEENDETTEGEEEIVSGAHIPMPTETFLEELSVKMQLHPISVYWLLEELKAEGARCKPEELRLLEDRLSVLILRLLGHRWPKQLEAGEPVPAWASSDGIIPLVAGTGEATLAEQVRARLRVEDGELGVQQTEALLTELTGQSLEEWLRRRFFSRHVSQFKYRPIAWHLASTPTHNGKKKRGGSQRSPAFECLLYYHACSGDALARIRTQYVEPLLRAERQKMEEAYLFQDETTSVLANERIQELEAFVEKLRFIEEQGFACPELQRFMALEPLDRWSGDGYLAPTSREELLRNEQAWRADINDGVRVNIAPLQLAGVLASDVLKPADAKKALADRARWRADERRWVRNGKLPRCGWMDERVPESPRWTEREPERVAEQIKLEQKRQALQGRRAEEVEI